MHCFQRATWRLACSSIISTPTAVSRSRCVAKAHSVFPLRVATHNSYRFALQARYYSDHDDVSTLPLDRDRDSSLKVEAQNPDEVEDAELLGKRATRLKRLEALGPPRAPSDTVYMGNLFFDLTAEDLRKHMEQYGAVLKAVIVYDNRGVSKGFGYVQYETVEQAQNAIEKQNLQILAGRQVVVQYARSHLDVQEKNIEPSNTLFVGGIPFELTDRDLQDLFRDVKNVIDIRVPVDRRTGMPRGFAHAEFLNVEYALRGKEVLMRKEPYGRKLRVHFAERRRVGMMLPSNENARAQFEQRAEEREHRRALEDELREAEAERDEIYGESSSKEYVR